MRVNKTKLLTPSQESAFLEERVKDAIVELGYEEFLELAQDAEVITEKEADVLLDIKTNTGRRYIREGIELTSGRQLRNLMRERIE